MKTIAIALKMLAAAEFALCTLLLAELPIAIVLLPGGLTAWVISEFI